MRGYDDAEIYDRLSAILAGGEGMTGSEISKRLGISRITTSKYLESFELRHMMHSKTIGNSKVWHISDQARFVFPDDYARAGTMFAESVLGLSQDGASGVIRSCLGHGATHMLLLTEVLIPAIDTVRKSYADGKIGRPEKSLMYDIMYRCMLGIDGSADPLHGRNAILLAADEDGEQYAHAAAVTLQNLGWRVMDLGNMSHAIDVLFDTELEKLLARTRAPGDGITIMAIFSSEAAILDALASAAAAARRGPTKDVHLAVCGPQTDDMGADASVHSPGDVVHWAQSL